MDPRQSFSTKNLRCLSRRTATKYYFVNASWNKSSLLMALSFRFMSLMVSKANWISLDILITSFWHRVWHLRGNPSEIAPERVSGEDQDRVRSGGGSVLDPISEGLFSALGWGAADSGSLAINGGQWWSWVYSSGKASCRGSFILPRKDIFM